MVKFQLERIRVDTSSNSWWSPPLIPRWPQFQFVASLVFKYLGAAKIRQDDRSSSQWILTNKLVQRCFSQQTRCVECYHMEQAMRNCPCPICAFYFLFISLCLSFFLSRLLMHCHDKTPNLHTHLMSTLKDWPHCRL